VGSYNPDMPVLLIQKPDKALIVDFDPTREVQTEVEGRYAVTFSRYYEDRARAEREIDSAKAGWYSGSNRLRCHNEPA